MKEMWEERYAADEYAYGEEPSRSSSPTSPSAFDARCIESSRRP